MHLRTALVVAAVAAAARGAEPVSAPVLAGSNATAVQSAGQQLLSFRGAQLLNEFVYRAVLKLPDGSGPTQETAREVAAQLAVFLREAGYELATVRTQVKGSQIDVTIDEGGLDKIIVVGVGWLGALRLRAKLNLPLDVFNRRLFEVQMPQLA